MQRWIASALFVAHPQPVVVDVAWSTRRAVRAGRLRAMAGCVFCSVIAGETPAALVLDDERVLAFLDRSPLFKGHVLVVPRTHVDTLTDLAAHDVATYFAAVQRVAAALPSALGADGTFVAINNVVSQSVPHLHTHVVPRRRKDGLRGFFWPRERYSDASEMESYAAAVRRVLDERA